mgnify:CR=1 FL=1
MNDMSHHSILSPLRSKDLPETVIPCVSVPVGFPMPDLRFGKTVPVAAYDYRHEDGALAFLVARCV